MITAPAAEATAGEAACAAEPATAPLTLGLSDTLAVDELLASAPEVAEPEPAIASPEPIEASRGLAAALRGAAPAITAAVLTIASAGLWFFVGSGDDAVVNAAPEALPPATEATVAVADSPPPAELPEEALAAKPIEEQTSAVASPAPESEAPRPSEAPIRLAAAVAPAPTAPQPAAVEAIDPFDYDPTTIDLVLRRGGPPAEQPSREPTPLPATPEPSVTERLDARLAAAGRVGDVRVLRGPNTNTKGPGPSAPAEALLAAKLPAIDLEGVPLVEAIELLSELSGVPLSLRPGALRRAGVDARRPIAIRGENQTFASLIAETFKPHRLSVAPAGANAVLARAGDDRIRSITHRVGDLVGDDSAGFAELLEAVGPEGLPAPLAINTGQLALETDQRTHQELMLLCERLRLARGLPQQSKYPRDRLATRPSLAELDKALTRRTTFSFVEPTPLRGVVDHWRRVTGLVVLVDWPSVAEAGLGPRSTLECAATNRPLSEALDGVLNPLGLAWGPVDAETLWIASRELAAATRNVEFYPVDASLGPDMARRIAAETPNAGVVYDADARAAIVRGDADAQRTAYRLWRSAADR